MQYFFTKSIIQCSNISAPNESLTGKTVGEQTKRGFIGMGRARVHAKSALHKNIYDISLYLINHP